MEAPKCNSCGEVMAEGYIPDSGYFYREVWVEGRAQWSWSGRLKMTGKRFAVTAYRCPKCGRIETFALEPVSS